MSRAAAVYGARGMVVSGHSAATLAGWETLVAGGSVADAAIAAAAVLTVVLPQACTLGGDAFILVHDAAARKTHGLNASGPSPAAATHDRFAGGMPQHGPFACTVPGVVGGWQALSRRFGRLAWPALLERAIAAAENGFPVSPVLARSMATSHKEIAADRDCAALFLDDGKPFAVGAVLRQPALARSLRTIAAGGAAAFYDGPIGRSLAGMIGRKGGPLAAADLAGFEPRWVEPIETGYRGLRVQVMPPNSFGLYMLLQLELLRDIGWREMGPQSPARFSALIRAARAAFAVGKGAVADPEAWPEDAGDLLGPAGRTRLRAAYLGQVGAAGPANRGGTAVVSVADAAGNAAIIVQSICLVFGSAIADGETGILLNDRMIGFDTVPGHPNVVAPRKRPAHTLNPVMVLADDRPRYVLGTPGGPGQTITLTQVLNAAVDLGLTLAEAIGAPRWSMDLGAEAVIEASMPVATAAGLRDLGMAMSPGAPGSPFFGSAEAIEFLPGGVLCGIADHRREAAALGI